MIEPVQVDVDREQLLASIRHDCVTFFAFYIGEDLTLDIPQLHIEVWDELLHYLELANDPEFLIGNLQKLFAIPREHSKSTIAKLAVILFMRYSVFRLTLYISKTSPIATAAIRDVVAWFQSANECALYGTPTMEKKNETEGLWIMQIGVPTSQRDGFGHTIMRRKQITLKAVGQGHQVRGTLINNMRPEFVVMDDIEDLDTADSGPQQEKLDNWVLGSTLKAFARRSFVLFIGNMLRSTTLLARLAQDETWSPTVFGALVKDKVTGELKALWEGRWTVPKLLAEYKSYRKLGKGHIWEAEMMNLSADKLLAENLDNAIILTPMHPEEVSAGFIILDPAFGQKSFNDESALTVHVRSGRIGIPALVDSRAGRWTEEQILNEFIDLSYYWNLTTWVIEANAAQRLFIPLFRLLLKDRQINPDIFTILPITAGKEVKGNRISAFRRILNSKSYAMTENQIDLKLKLEEYSPDTKVHDDLCDSASMGPLAWDTYGVVIEANGVQSVSGRLLQLAGSTESQSGNRGEIDVCSF